MKRRLFAGALGLALIVATMTGCTGTTTEGTNSAANIEASAEAEASLAPSAAYEEGAEENSVENDAQYIAGTYTGNATGMAGNIEVMVTFSDSKISDIQIGEQNETSGICETVYEVLPEEILAYQSLAVDSISGATITSAAVKNAVTDAVTQAGGDVTALQSVEVPNKMENSDYEYDVVVAGGGLSGLMAAYEAASMGAKVALIEKTGILGGTSVTASGIFACAENEEAIDPMYEAWQTRNASQENNTLELDMVRALCEASPSVIALIENAGAEYTINVSESTQAQTFFASANEASTKNAADIKLASKDASAKGGAQLIEALVKKCEDIGVEIYRNTPGTSLLIADDGQVNGIVSETEKYGAKTFHAKAVVLATGDYAQNVEMTAEINPRAAGEISATAVGNTGDGITMALSAGGILDEYLETTASGSTVIKAYKQDSLEALAADMEVEAATLIATVEKYNKMCEQGEDTDCGKAPEYLSAIDDGTYYAILMYDGTRGNYGGIVTNSKGAVVNERGDAISGLYAGGIISSGAFFGDYYPGGQALAVASHMGYIAGNSAAEYALSN